MSIEESFNIFRKRSKIILPNPAKEHLDFEYNQHNEHQKPYDEQHFMEHEPTINNNEQKKSIESYKRDSYYINGALWGNKDAMATEGHHIQPIHELLKTAPKASSDFHVYTGVNSPTAKLKGDVHIPAFTSSSPDHRIAGLFATNPSVEEMRTDDGTTKKVNVTHVIKIHVKKGQHVGGYIGDIGSRRHEKEFLINKGHTLHFSGKTEDHLVHDGGMLSTPTVMRVHHATISMDDDK